MALSHAQIREARIIISEGQRLGAPRHVIRVALGTWLTENPQLVSGGDRDSEGPFQQRPSTGWGPTSESDRVDARQFYQHAIPLFHQGERGGHLAQAVQGSAFPDRYAPNVRMAGGIIRGLGDSASAVKPAKPQPPTVTSSQQTQTRVVQPTTMLPNPLATAIPVAGPTFPTQRPGEVQRRKSAKGTQINPLTTQGQVTKEITTSTSTPAPVPVAQKQAPVKGGNNMVATALQAAKSVKGTPYVWGGGHGGFSSNPSGLDCSGAVSYVLHKLGVLKAPLTSGSMGSVLKPGPGAITVFYNAGHTFMRFQTPHGPVYWGTSVGDAGSGGLGKHPAPSGSYLSEYNVGHVQGAGAAQVAAAVGAAPQKMKQAPPTTTQTIRVTNGVYTQAPIFSNRPILSDSSQTDTPSASTSSGLEGKVRSLLR